MIKLTKTPILPNFQVPSGKIWCFLEIIRAQSIVICRFHAIVFLIATGVLRLHAAVKIGTFSAESRVMFDDRVVEKGWDAVVTHSNR